MDVLQTMCTKSDTIDLDKAIEVITRPLGSNDIKQREIGFGDKKKVLDYVEGHTVINLLNEAFNYCWSFEITETTITKTDQYEKKNFKTGQVYATEEPKTLVLVKGRLTIPGLGVREQYGTKIALGDASVQESTIKAAATDALKKCATLIGIGIELYDDPKIPETDYSNRNFSQPEAPPPPVASLNDEYVAQIRDLRKELGMTSSEEMNPFIVTATKGAITSFQDISNDNATAIIAVLRAEADSR